MGKVINFKNWAKKFAAIQNSDIEVFLNLVPTELELHDMKREFADKYQNKIELSFSLNTDFKELSATNQHRNFHCDGVYSYGYSSSEGWGSGCFYGDSDFFDTNFVNQCCHKGFSVGFGDKYGDAYLYPRHYFDTFIIGGYGSEFKNNQGNGNRRSYGRGYIYGDGYGSDNNDFYNLGT